MLYFKPFEQISLSTIEELVADGVTESRFLDFKEEPPSQDSRSFLETVTAFANSQGGVVLYGVKELRAGNEKTGKIGEISGFESSAIDSLKGKLENFIRDSVQPRLDYRIREVPLANGRYLLLLRVNQGWQAPYFFKFQKGWCFYRRAESQNVPMDHGEIKETFLRNDSVRDRLHNFREQRTQKIRNQELPVVMQGERLFITHVLALDSFRDARVFEQNQLVNIDVVGPQSSCGYTARPNLDGVFQYWSEAGGDHSKPISYVQYFRNGSIEYVDGFILSGGRDGQTSYIKAVGDSFNPSLRRAIQWQKGLGLVGPFYAGVSLWNVKGLRIAQSNDPWGQDSKKVN